MKVGLNSSLNSNSVNSQISSVRKKQEEAMNKLVTGLKINSAKDDAAGLQIANRLASQSSGVQVAIRNANDAYSLASVADSALSGVNDAADSISELSLRAANASLSSVDREAIQQEITQIQGQVSDIQTNTTFAGQSLFSGSNDSQFQLGANANTTIGLSLPDLTDQLGELQIIDVTTQAGAQAAVDSSRQVGEYVNSSISSLSNSYEQNEAARSRIQDTDFAQTSADKAQAGFLADIGVALQAQANVSKGQALNLLN